MPMLQRVMLPELRNADAVKNLTEPQSYGFFRGYYPGEHVPPPGERLEKILAAIGRAFDALMPRWHRHQ